MTKSEKTPEKLMRIGEVAAATGLSTQTIEYYIMLGMVAPIRRNNSRNRYFDAKHIRRIKLIRKLNQSGYTLRDIRETYLKGK